MPDDMVKIRTCVVIWADGEDLCTAISGFSTEGHDIPEMEEHTKRELLVSLGCKDGTPDSWVKSIRWVNIAMPTVIDIPTVPCAS